jgi:SSS family solute:Na+ symporter
MHGLNAMDIIVFGLYIIILIFIGFWAGRKKNENAEDFFISRNKLPWYVIGFAIIATGISSEQFLGTVGFAYNHGLAVANWEWTNAPALLILILIFTPLYLRKKIITMPQFLEKRYDSKLRTLFAIITLLTFIFIYLSGVIFSGGFVLNVLFGINLYVAIWSLAIIAGMLTIYGGMASVAWVQFFQSIILLGGGLLVFFLGINQVPGGLDAIIGTGSRSHLILPASDPNLPWPGIVVLALSTNLWYFGTNQTLNQSVLGAKNEWHAKMGIVLAGFLYIIIAFADVFPGLIAFALNPNLPNDAAYPYVVNNLIPVGLKGLVFAGLVGAIMSTIEGIINATSTVFTFDIYSRFFNKEASTEQMIKVGRITSGVVLIIGGLWAPVVLRFGHIFSYFQECLVFIAIPSIVVFTMGVFTKKITNKAALWVMLMSFPMFLMPYFLRLFQIKMNVFNFSGIVLVLVILFVIIASAITSKTTTRSIEGYIWKYSMRKLPDALFTDGYPWYKRVSFWAAVMTLIYIVIYVIWW